LFFVGLRIEYPRQILRKKLEHAISTQLRWTPIDMWKIVTGIRAPVEVQAAFRLLKRR